jgi:hypothetical protein
MDRLQRFALKKTADGLDKVLKAKEHFDKREEKKTYTKKLISLKQQLTEAMFHGEIEHKEEVYDQISRLNFIQSKHAFDTQDKRFIDDLSSKYKDK